MKIKKIAFLLSIIMLIGSCFVMISCESSNNSSKATPLERAKESVERDFEAEYIASNIVYGNGKSFSSCTFDTIEDLGGNNFEIIGRVTIKDKNGNYRSAKYTATVEYNAANDTYNASTKVIGSFS